MSFYKLGLTALAVAVVGISVSLFSSTQFSPSEDESTYIFNTEWDDSGNLRKLQLKFDSRDGSVELYDLQRKKMFLKRYLEPNIKEEDLYIGNTLLVLSRQLKISGYGDVRTEQKLSKLRQKTFAMIKPDAVHRLGEIVELVQSRGFQVTEMKMVKLSREEAATFYEEHTGRSFFEPMLEYVTSGNAVAIELQRREAVTQWRKNLGPTDSRVAQQQVPGSVRALFGTDKTMNAAHGSDSDQSASRELSFFFGAESERSSRSGIRAVASHINNTLCIIKPHAVSAGHMGAIISAFTKEGFRITGLQMFRITKKQAKELLEIYEGVLNEYPKYLQQLTSGPLLAMEISGDSELEIPKAVREFVGPDDPAIAKQLRPNSIRARFGKDKSRNAVHCSDLPEDGPLEVDYFFKILQPQFQH